METLHTPVIEPPPGTIHYTHLTLLTKTSLLLVAYLPHNIFARLSYKSCFCKYFLHTFFEENTLLTYPLPLLKPHYSSHSLMLCTCHNPLSHHPSIQFDSTNLQAPHHKLDILKILTKPVSNSHPLS